MYVTHNKQEEDDRNKSFSDQPLKPTRQKQPPPPSQYRLRDQPPPYKPNNNSSNNNHNNNHSSSSSSSNHHHTTNMSANIPSVWLWLADDESWERFDSQETSVIMKSIGKGHKGAILQRGTVAYFLDLLRLTQTNAVTGRRRPIYSVQKGANWLVQSPSSPKGDGWVPFTHKETLQLEEAFFAGHDFCVVNRDDGSSSYVDLAKWTLTCLTTNATCFIKITPSTLNDQQQQQQKSSSAGQQHKSQQQQQQYQQQSYKEQQYYKDSSYSKESYKEQQYSKGGSSKYDYSGPQYTDQHYKQSPQYTDQHYKQSDPKYTDQHYKSGGVQYDNYGNPIGKSSDYHHQHHQPSSSGGAPSPAEDDYYNYNDQQQQIIVNSGNGGNDMNSNSNNRKSKATWRWHDDNHDWNSYNDEITDAIEAAWATGANDMVFVFENTQYYVDLQNLTQTNIDTGYTRPIQRVSQRKKSNAY